MQNLLQFDQHRIEKTQWLEAHAVMFLLDVSRSRPLMWMVPESEEPLLASSRPASAFSRLVLPLPAVSQGIWTGFSIIVHSKAENGGSEAAPGHRH